MPTLKLTSKRQATLPVAACEALAIEPGDLVDLESATLDGEQVWVLRPRRARDRRWVGCLSGDVEKVDDHSMSAVRESIRKGRNDNATAS